MPGIFSLLPGSPNRVSLIQKTPFGSDGTALVIDVADNVTISRKSSPTKFPVENGTNVTDNILLEPYACTIKGIQSDTPISLLKSAIATGVSAILPPIGIVGAAIGSVLADVVLGSTSPSQMAYNLLKNFQENKVALDILTKYERLTDMYVDNISIPRDPGTGHALVFDVSLVKLIIVKPQTTNIAVFKNPDGSAMLVDTGKQQASENQFVKGFKAAQTDIGAGGGG